MQNFTIKQGKPPKTGGFYLWRRERVRVIAKRASLLAKAERQPCDARVHATGGTMQRNVQNPFY